MNPAFAWVREAWSSKTISLRSHIFVMFAVPYCVLFAALAWIADRTATRTALLATQAQFEQVGQRTSESIYRLEEPARSWLAAMTSNPVQGLRGTGDLALLRIHMTVLERSPQMASVYFGYANGEFVRVLQLKDEAERKAVRAPSGARYALQTIHVSPGGDSNYEVWDFYSARMAPLSTESRGTSRFDPRQRPWYKASALTAAGQVNATAPYRFSFPANLGVTMSANLGHNSSAYSGFGVGGVDFSLTNLSNFLAVQKAASTVQSMIFDGKGNLWAWSDVSAYNKLLEGGKIPSVAALPQPALRGLVDASKPMRPGGQSSGQSSGRYMELTHPDGSAFSASLFSVERFGGESVYIVVVDERANVFEPVQQLRLRMLLIGLLGLVGGAALISLLAKRLSTPMRNVAVQSKLVERFRFSEIQPVKTSIREVKQLQASVKAAAVVLAGYARYVPKPLVRHLMAVRAAPQPGVEPREVAALYAAFPAPLHMPSGTSSVAFERLNGVLHLIDSSRGLVDALDNNGMRAFWNAPLLQSNPALRACEAAYQAIEQLDASRSNDDGAWPIHVGIDLGMACVGSFGTPTGRLLYSAVGQPVEQARELAELAKALGVPLVLTDAVAGQINKRFALTRLAVGKLSLPSRLSGQALWTVAGRTEGSLPVAMGTALGNEDASVAVANAAATHTVRRSADPADFSEPASLGGPRPLG